MTAIPRIWSFVIAATLVPPVAAQAPEHPTRPQSPVEGVDFRVYDGQGRSRSFADLLSALDETDALLVGEEHDDVTGHAVEAEILVRAAQRLGTLDTLESGRAVVLSLEMFERDVQYVLDEYLAGLITEEQFTSSARPWDRYDTDYRRMIEFARAHRLPVVAANAPRRYVNRVSRLGSASLEDLPSSAKAFLPPLPYPAASEVYTTQWNELMTEMVERMSRADTTGSTAEGAADEPEADGATEGGGGEERATAPEHDLSKALEAQALWDAAMAESVARSLESHAGGLVVHYAGSFHVQWYTGIPEKVADYRPGTRVLTVVMQPIADVGAWDDDEHRDLADFVILTSRPEATETAQEPDGVSRR